MATEALDARSMVARRAADSLGDRRFVARAGIALVRANGRYWKSVAPTVRRELKRWRRRAQAIGDPELRALALAKLDGEGFHAEAAAMLATLATPAQRSSVAEAIVALELLFDYLDGLTELPSRDPLREGSRLFGALIDAVTFPSAVAGELVGQSLCNDGGYLEELSRAVGVALARLPGAGAITHAAQRIASRSGQAQTRMHAAPQLGAAQVEEWAISESHGSGLGWRELVAGSASSVLVLHALIVAAAEDDLTARQAGEIADAYLSTCVLLTVLDGLVDYEQDRSDGAADPAGYISLYEYEHPEELAETMAAVARRAIGQARALPNAPDHLMILAGVVAYYGCASGAEGELARPVVARLRGQLSPLMTPTLVLIRAWRRARRGPRRFGAQRESEN